MKLNLDQPAEDAQIQIIPLIDVIFCILTFFILASLQMTRQQAINIDLPQAATGQGQMREMLIVTIDNVGQTYLDKQPIDPATLFDRAKQYHEARPDGLIVVNASQNAYYNDVIRTIDVLRQVTPKVSLGTIEGKNNPNTPGSPIPGMPGTTFPGAPLPGSNFPGGIPGSSMPGGTMPGSTMPGGMPDSTMPGSNIPGSGVPNPNSPGSPLPNGSNPSDSLNPSNSTNPTQGPNPIDPNQPATQPNPTAPN
jgi:biopolymer transport protein ExbD